METTKPSKPSMPAMKRKSISVTQEALVKTGYLQPEQTLPVVIEPTLEGINLLDWAPQNRAQIDELLLQHGGILFRNFQIGGVPEFEQFIERVAEGGLLTYTYRSTPRSQVSGNIYTSTEYPADEHIPMHNEMSYTSSWPLKIWFYCVKAAEQGGETPIADSHKVYQRIDPAIRERFAEKKVMYVRNYGHGIDLPWETVFQTDDRSEVEAFCRANQIAFEWLSPEHLRTRQVCQAVARHPKTGRPLWFNQAHLFHVSSLKPEVRDALLAVLAEEDLPRNTYYGDGAPIEPEVLEHIRDAFQQEMVVFPWQEGDLMMLDNMAVAHGRSPFVGSRKTVVGMAEAFTSEDA